MEQPKKSSAEKREMTLIYTGSDEYQPTVEEQRAYRLYPYMPSDELREAVNLAIYLKRPLLIKGEPGSGKTRLAYAVAHEFSKVYYPQLKAAYERERAQAGDGGHQSPDGEVNPFEAIDDKGYAGWPFYFWSVKSTSRAQDGLYVYDAVGRLHNATLPPEEREKKEIEDYIEYGPLGKAFQTEHMRPIVLIDEIDKADIDFPNDLLIELEDPKFKVKELQNREINSDIDPIIFVTSNDEKDLPDAFLRRCIFYYIRFPNPDDLEAIVKKRVPDYDENLVHDAVGQFVELRKRLQAKKGSARKLPSTSELIDWVKALHYRTETQDLDKALSSEAFQKKKEDDEILAFFEDMGADQKLMADQVSNLLTGQLPFLSVLFKNWNDYSEYLQEEEERRKQQENAAEAVETSDGDDGE